MATLPFKLGGNDTTTVSTVVTYDPANTVINPDGSDNITDCDLSQVEVTVVGGAITIHLWRKQGESKSPWKSETLDPGVYTYQAGGPVKTFGDIASWQVVT